MKQFDIYWVDLNPTKGAETRKKRPCVIIQSTLLNKGSRTVIVAPLLPDHKNWPFVINIKPSKSNNLDKERNMNLKQIRAVDISRVSNKYGVLEIKYKKESDKILKLIFNID
jgi:mRNA interferase MazF